ncbi:locus notch homolog 1-like isoform X1 [Octopus vulgaris]|uniref:Delta-like protein n=1 Tax=Octopus vulgaris TaxID=6645 RepID=A0AA36B4R7_OCTVU|nr:locus notch homolog 1-like isoform X1 [Octopus vulgaris]
MLQLTSSLLLCTLVAVTISPIVANYVIDVKLIKFENFNRLLANRRQCSNFGTVQCQTSLSLCARPDSGTVTCEYGTRDMGVIGDNIINLNTSYVGTIRNPITLLVNQPFQKFTISFTTKDNQELMDQYDYNSRYNMPHKSIEEASYQMVTTPGQYGTGSQLTYQIRTYCSQGYYGPSCAVRCEIPIIEQVRFMCNNNGKRVCKPGFSGSFCNLNADVCRSSPCKNGATCTVQGSMFKCYCIPGYTGQYCNKVLSACSSITCLNGGTCVNSGTSFVCQCPPNFYGNLCQIEDKCRTVTCLNGGRCVTANMVAKCNCPSGFTGPRCGISINSCQPSPCQNGGTCYPNGIQFTCLCPVGFTGQRCDQRICPPNICQNGGTCQMINNQITCLCRSGYYGDRCRMTNHCNPQCQNGGICDAVTRRCNCPQGFLGIDCSSRDACGSNPNFCENGGTCQMINNQINCLCRSGFYGDRCRMTNQCNPQCQNGGICDVVTRRCNCPQGFLGIDCSSRDACGSNPNFCQNGGTCQVVNNQINCICPTGFYGNICQFPSPCFPKCQNGGTCNLNTRICDCPPEFGGRDCTIRNPCASKPCLNNGQCYVQESYNYTCTCTSGYTGKNCESLVTVCATNPCLNGGQCFPMGSNFVCACRQGWTGQRCEFQSDPCNPKPCLNNGGCTRYGTNDFTCSCINGWSGKICDQKNPAVNCLTNPCRNGGTCLYNANPVTCKCPSGFDGNYCEG